MTSALKACLDYVAPLPPKEKEVNWKEQFVRNAVTDIALLSLSTGLYCYFSISNEVRWDYIKQGISVFFVNLAARTVATSCRYAAISEKGLLFRTVSFAAGCFPSLNFGGINPFYFLIRHGGVAVSAYLLSQKATIQFVSTSINQWKISYNIVMSELAQHYLGKDRVAMVIQAAGPLAAVIASQISLIGALILKNSCPELSKYLFFHTLTSLTKGMGYGWPVYDSK